MLKFTVGALQLHGEVPTRFCMLKFTAGTLQLHGEVPAGAGTSKHVPTTLPLLQVLLQQTGSTSA
jgi:hypothetical protein